MSEVIEFDGVFAGNHISELCRKMAVLAANKNKPIHATFNDTEILAQPGESANVLEKRWIADFDAASKAYREHPDRIKEQLAAEIKEKAEREAKMVDTSAGEKEMREADVPWPKTKEQLAEYIDSLVTRQHDYGTCVYAMSMAATAAFNYVAGHLGVTGFQSSCADLDILRRVRHLKGPFMIVNGEDALYPQYDLVGRLEKSLEKWKPWLKEEAAKKLAESTHAAGTVVDHWKKLAGVE